MSDDPHRPPLRPNLIEDVSMALLLARQTRQPADALNPGWADIRPAEAWAIQERVLGQLDAGLAPAARGFWKAGAGGRDRPFTSAPLPRFGVHFGDEVRLDQSFFIRGIETELAFRLAQPFAPGSVIPGNDAELLAMFDAACISVEVVDSRWRQAMQAPDTLKLADGQSHGALVLGSWMTVPRLDWADLACEVRINDQLAIRQSGGHPCGDPMWVLRGWLAQATERDVSLRAGDVITTGSWNGIAWAAAGDTVCASFAQVGQLRLRFGAA